MHFIRIPYYWETLPFGFRCYLLKGVMSLSWGVLHHSAALQLEAYFETRQISANRERKEVQHGAYEEICFPDLSAQSMGGKGASKGAAFSADLARPLIHMWPRKSRLPSKWKPHWKSNARAKCHRFQCGQMGRRRPLR